MQTTETPVAALEDFNTRLLLAVHGIPVASLDERRANGARSVADVVRELVREELRVLRTLDENAPTFDAAAEELRALRKMVLRRVALSPDLDPKKRGIVDALADAQEKRLLEIQRIARDRGLKTTKSPDVSRAVALRPESAALRSPGAGIEVRDLWREGDRKALHVTMPPGSKWPGLDYHIPGPEEVYVIAGDLNDGPVTHNAGAFVHYPAGSSHSPSTRNGCTLFVFYPEG